MVKCCENCKHCIYDSAPWGSTSASFISGCKREDDMSEEDVISCEEEGCCSLYEEVEEEDYSCYLEA